MQVMGMRNSAVWLVWIFVTAISMVIICILFTLFLSFGGLLPRSNPLLVFFLIFAYILSLLAFCFVLATIMHQAITGAIVTVLIFTASFIPFAALLASDAHFKLWQKIIGVRK